MDLELLVLLVHVLEAKATTAIAAGRRRNLLSLMQVGGSIGCFMIDQSLTS